MEKEDILRNDDRGPSSIINNGEGPQILEKKALKKMKKRQETEPDEILSEMLTALSEFGIKEITKLLNIIHDTGEIPTDLKKSLHITIPKTKGQLNKISTAQ